MRSLELEDELTDEEVEVRKRTSLSSLIKDMRVDRDYRTVLGELLVRCGYTIIGERLDQYNVAVDVRQDRVARMTTQNITYYIVGEADPNRKEFYLYVSHRMNGACQTCRWFDLDTLQEIFTEETFPASPVDNNFRRE